MDIQLLKEISDYLEENYQLTVEDDCVCMSLADRECIPGFARIPGVDEEVKTFAETLFGFIDSHGITVGQAANRAGVDRRVISKIRNNPKLKPTKKTIFSFAVGIRLTEEETVELLMKAGYAFSDTSKSDLIIRYFIENGNYDIWEINETLHYYGQEPICC